MLIIGLTGGIGSGKTTVAQEFTKIGVPIIDADIIAQELTTRSTILNKIATHFGPEILQPNGQLCRKCLGEIVFQKHEERKWLEELLHPLVYQEISKRLKKITAPYCIVVIPLLIETAPKNFVDRILVIAATEKEQITRILKRDKTSVLKAKKIIHTQISAKERQSHADDIIYNHDSKEKLREQVEKLHTKYLSLSKTCYH